MKSEESSAKSQDTSSAPAASNDTLKWVLVAVVALTLVALVVWRAHHAH